MQNPDPVRATYDELIRAVAVSGEEAAWQALYEHLNPPLNTYAQTILRTWRCIDPPEHSRDVTQEAWVRTVKAIQQCAESPTGWLFKITRNASIDHLRACVRFSGELEALTESTAAAESFFHLHHRLYSHEELFIRSLSLQQALSCLTSDEQLILELRLNDLDYREIERLTGTPEVNARKILQRAKMKLRATLADGGS
jgi:RNA polymerase sigma factor (sigma-70 family)